MKTLLHRLHKKPVVYIFYAVLAILLAATASLIYYHGPANSPPSYSRAAPDFKALTPPDTKPDWRQLSPDKKSDSVFYVFTDKIDGVEISVSQQPLPPSFRDDPEGKVSVMARSFNANETMRVGRLEIHLGTSAKGPQSVIFSDGELLVLIKSDKSITKGAWADYIKSLKHQ